MNLDDLKKHRVAGWIEEGLKLSDIQSKLASEFGLTLTYMEVRLLVNDLKLMPKDQPERHAVPPAAAPQASAGAGLSETEAAPEALPGELPGDVAATPQPGTGGISVSVDRVARPGALVSGSVTFSDGNAAAWYLDQTGRLGLVPKQTGYRPSQPDLQTFQLELQKELQKLGF
jgi:hypothetical protein